MAQETQDSTVVRLVNGILIEAVQSRTSDIHIETSEQEISIRYRTDGVLIPQFISEEMRESSIQIVSRLKVMANLDIAERRLPQDGRIALKVGGRDIDIRVSCIPSLYGEGIVMRILDKSAMKFSLRGLGMAPTNYELFSNLIRLPHGLILITGPTGSGKTTTLYSALTALNKPGVKIITAEDPVEYRLEGISQIQINERIGLTFASLLRRILRHDPDVVLVGEMRDLETIEIALQAAMTGHLVFSTLHTNDAAGAYTRLLSQGVEPFLVSSCVDAVVAQRLVRNLCQHCKKPYDPDGDELPEDFPRNALQGQSEAVRNVLKGTGVGDGKIYRAVGCPHCRNVGYRGRSGVFELLSASDRVRELVEHNTTAWEIKRTAIEDGMLTLRMDGWRKVLAGETTVEEVVRVTRSDATQGH
ncbi:MAG: Flp pilus assembly complex ATPase component TadA [Planctomycetaceae bacterium]|nr:Flp pilus assembly complex ATPase component TadA [Planctomycetaceae bacterium]